MAGSDKNQHSEKEIDERMTRALKRALKTPVKPKRPGKSESTKKGGGMRRLRDKSS